MHHLESHQLPWTKLGYITVSSSQLNDAEENIRHRHRTSIGSADFEWIIYNNWLLQRYTLFVAARAHLVVVQKCCDIVVSRWTVTPVCM